MTAPALNVLQRHSHHLNLKLQVEQQTEKRSASHDEGKYRIHARVEIAFILRAIVKSSALVTAYFGSGKDFIVTAILDVDADAESIIIDSGSNPVLNERLLRGQQLSLVSSQDGVKVEFEVEQIEAMSFEGRLAFRLPFPDSLLKLQRREFYRLAAPLLNPLKCQIPTATGMADTVVGDISLGGVSLMGEHEGLDLQLGTIYANCRILLPELGVIQTKLMVRNSFPMTLRNGAVIKRTGCAFLDLPSSQQAMIQRYIIRLERDRRAKLADPRL
jgi:c-di-GMP-binding flagellar brake protein YcgR